MSPRTLAQLSIVLDSGPPTRAIDAKSGDTVDLEQISPGMIPAVGTALFGAHYEYVDVFVRKSGVVHYYLEDIDADGVANRHGPVVIDFGTAGKPGKMKR